MYALVSGGAAKQARIASGKRGLTMKRLHSVGVNLEKHIMYVPSTASLCLKKGQKDHSNNVFVNKATKGQIENGEAVDNTPEGMARLGEALEGAKALKDRTMYMIGRGQTPVTEVAEGMQAGEILAFQYHNERYDEPSWKISLGFIADVDRKNAEYAAKRSKTAKKGKTSKAATKSTKGLIS